MTLDRLREHLQARGVTCPIEPGPSIPPQPPGRLVGDQGDYADAETLAWLVDGALLRQPWPSWALRVIRSGGGPAPLTQDDAQRWHFTANYLLEAPSGLEVSL